MIARASRAVAVALAPLALALASASATATYYADTCIERASGDVAGEIVTIAGPAAAPRVTLTWSEGALMAPLAVVAHLDRVSHRLTFAAHGEAGPFRFDGHLDRRVLVGRLSEPWRGPREVTLRAMPAARAERPSAPCPPISPAARRDRR